MVATVLLGMSVIVPFGMASVGKCTSQMWVTTDFYSICVCHHLFACVFMDCNNRLHFISSGGWALSLSFKLIKMMSLCMCGCVCVCGYKPGSHESQPLRTETCKFFTHRPTIMIHELWSEAKNQVSLTYLTGKNPPPKKWAWVGIFKAAELPSLWPAC